MSFNTTCETNYLPCLLCLFLGDRFYFCDLSKSIYTCLIDIADRFFIFSSKSLFLFFCNSSWMSMSTSLPICTVAMCIVQAYFSLYMEKQTPGTQDAKSIGVIGAFLINYSVSHVAEFLAFLVWFAYISFFEIITFWNLPEIELVKESTCRTVLACPFCQHFYAGYFFDLVDMLVLTLQSFRARDWIFKKLLTRLGEELLGFHIYL